MGSNNDISLKALAKINLGLDVVRRREDGYHEVRMIMQTIHLYDRLDIDRKSTRLNSSHWNKSRMPSSA